MKARIGLAVALLLAGGCSTTKKLYDGPERDASEIVSLRASNSYVFSINNRRTDHSREPQAQLHILPGTQQLIVHLDDRMAESYGHVGVRTVFCALAGHEYTVYPVPDMVARLWEPAVRDEATGQDVSPRPCPGSSTIGAAPQPTPQPGVQARAPKPETATPPPASAPTVAAPSAPTPVPTPPPTTPTSPAGPPAPATTAPPAQAATPVTPPPGVLAPGATAKLRAPARTRSLVDAPAVNGLGAGVAVTLKVVLKKDTGAWWYVTGPSGSGWVREADLEPPVP